MNRKVTLPELVEALTLVTNTTKRVSETFLREFFALISEQLISGESVKIKGLGVFKVVNVDARKSVDINTGEDIIIAAHNKVSFTADKELAEAVNLPFASFETVMLSDDIPAEQMKIIEEDSEVESVVDSVVTPVIEVAEPELEVEVDSPEIPEVAEVAEVVEENTSVESDAKDVVAEPKEQELVDEPLVDVEVEDEVEVLEEESDDDSDDEVVEPINYSESMVRVVEEDVNNDYLMDVKVNRRKFASGYMWGFISAVVVAAAVFFTVNFDTTSAPKYVDGIDVNVVAGNISANEVLDMVDSVYNVVNLEIEKPVAPLPVVAEVAKYDTITKTRFMATMAREYYGNMNFWVYIYEENRAKIKNPNVIAPGTVLVIPAAEKYGINANDPESVRVAEIKAKGISARYK